jgi:hypothetical protein
VQVRRSGGCQRPHCGRGARQRAPAASWWWWCSGVEVVDEQVLGAVVLLGPVRCSVDDAGVSVPRVCERHESRHVRVVVADVANRRGDEERLGIRRCGIDDDQPRQLPCVGPESGADIADGRRVGDDAEEPASPGEAEGDLYLLGPGVQVVPFDEVDDLALVDGRDVAVPSPRAIEDRPRGFHGAGFGGVVPRSCGVTTKSPGS